MWSIDLSKKGLELFLKEWQLEVLRVLWRQRQKDLKKGLGSKEIHALANAELFKRGERISRAAVISFLDDMAKTNLSFMTTIINFTTITGKGGIRGIYSINLDEVQFVKHLLKITIERLNEELMPLISD